MMFGREKGVMRRRVQQWVAVLGVCAVTQGCLLNSVRSINSAPRTKPDTAHAIVVIGMGLDVTWPYKQIQLTLPEYSVEKKRMTGNCYHYNRIQASRPSIPAKVAYLVFEVPANAYVYPDLVDTLERNHSQGTHS